MSFLDELMRRKVVRVAAAFDFAGAMELIAPARAYVGYSALASLPDRTPSSPTALGTLRRRANPITV